MAAGLGFKTFTTGEVLSAADVNGYLMQGVLVFASAVARDAAITSPQEGQFAYLKDTNVTTYYTGSAWANVDSTGMTNPMTTTGDTIYSSSGSTPARLAIGSTGNVLTVAGGVPTWAAPAGGGKVLQVVQGTSTTSTTISSTSFTSTTLTASITPSATTSKILILTSQACLVNRTSNQMGGGIRLVRGSTYIFGDNSSSAPNRNFYWTFVPVTDMQVQTQFNLSYLDSPSTTSSTTYTTQAAINSAGSMTFQNSSQTASMILLEIGA
jgi:hypothetical protein